MYILYIYIYNTHIYIHVCTYTYIYIYIYVYVYDSLFVLLYHIVFLRVPYFCIQTIIQPILTS